LQVGQQGLRQDVQALQQDVQSLQQGQQGLRQDVQALQVGQQGLRQDVQALQEGQKRIEIRMENEVIEKISALFDGFSLRGNQIDNLKKHLDDRFDDIVQDLNYLVRKSARQDTAIEELRRAK
jgi:predicted  nucleic acid-binding Zn-ribbon protein